MLEAEPHGIATAQARVEQDVERQSLAGADGPSFFKAGKFVLGPGVKADFVIPAFQQSHAFRGVAGDVLVLQRPREQTTHGLQEVVRAVRCGGPSLAAFADHTLVNLCQPLAAG